MSSEILSNLQHNTKKAWSINEKLYSIKIKNFCSANNVKIIERNYRLGEDIKLLVSIVHKNKNLLQLN